MTTLDASKLKRILSQAGFVKFEYESIDLELFKAVWKAAQAEQREECAALCERIVGGDGELNDYWLHDITEAIREGK